MILTESKDYADFSAIHEIRLHNPPHGWIGGNMASGFSPDDPMFFLHHANVDRLWSLQQGEHKIFSGMVTSLPRSARPFVCVRPEITHVEI